MIEAEFEHIRYFTPSEVQAVNGGTLRNVNPDLIKALDYVRYRCGFKFQLLSLNQGEHEHEKNSYHYKNMAVDFAPSYPISSPVLYEILRHAIDAGFRGIGLYKNERGVWSVHLDLREHLSIWTARKDAGVWKYSQMKWGDPL